MEESLSKPKRRATNRWTPEEHARLEELVSELGTEQWTEIAARMPGRTNKQVRQHWVNFQRPDTKQAGWSADEEDIIAHMHATYGPSWSVIARCLGNRTENSIKNLWHASFRSKASAARHDSILCVYITLLHEGNKPNLSTYHKAKAQVAAFTAAAAAAAPAAETGIAVPPPSQQQQQQQHCVPPAAMMCSADTCMPQAARLPHAEQLQACNRLPPIQQNAMLPPKNVPDFLASSMHVSATTGSPNSDQYNNGLGHLQQECSGLCGSGQVNLAALALRLSDRSVPAPMCQVQTPFAADASTISPHSSIPQSYFSTNPSSMPMAAKVPGLKSPQQLQHRSSNSSGHVSASSLHAHSYDTPSASEPVPEPASATSLLGSVRDAACWNKPARSAGTVPDHGFTKCAVQQLGLGRPAPVPMQSCRSLEQLSSWASEQNAQMLEQLQLSHGKALQQAASMPQPSNWPQQQHQQISAPHWRTNSQQLPCTPAMSVRLGHLEPSPEFSSTSTDEMLVFDPDSPMGWDVSIVEPVANNNETSQHISDSAAIGYGRDGTTSGKKRAYQELSGSMDMTPGRFSFKRSQTCQPGAPMYTPARVDAQPQPQLHCDLARLTSVPIQAHTVAHLSSSSMPSLSAAPLSLRAQPGVSCMRSASGLPVSRVPTPPVSTDAGLDTWLDSQLSTAWGCTTFSKSGNAVMQQDGAGMPDSQPLSASVHHSNDASPDIGSQVQSTGPVLSGSSSISQFTTPTDAQKQFGASDAMLRSLMIITPPGSQDLLALLDSLQQ